MAVLATSRDEVELKSNEEYVFRTVEVLKEMGCD
jgi:hypothetical protein